MPNFNSSAVRAPATETSERTFGSMSWNFSNVGCSPLPNGAFAPGQLSLPMVADRATVSGAVREAANDAIDRTPPPPVPTRMSEAIKLYLKEMASDAENCARTLIEKERLLNDLVAYVVGNDPLLAKNPFAHEIGPRAVADYVNDLRGRPGKSRYEDGRETTAAPRTIDKKIRFLLDFFGFCLEPLEAVTRNPALSQYKIAVKLKKAAAREDRHYLPFTDRHLEEIFEPTRYLRLTRSPDLFWIPILGVHFGGREGEFAPRTVDCVGYDEEAGIWFMDIPVGKNYNSIRRLPITQPLVDLGFIEYVQHVKALGAKYLFPHRDYTRPTLARDPSKYSCRGFAMLLTECGIIHPDLVFHSFRHTVVGALHDAGVSLIDAMQICGHEAQDHAIRAGVITRKQAASVHLRTYTAAGQPRTKVNSPIVRFKTELERAIALPLDYAKLRIAANVVREHLVRTPDGFAAGWPGQNKRYGEEQVARLGGPGQLTKGAA